MKIRWKRLKGQSHVDPGFARAWRDAGRNLRHPHPLVVEAATVDVDDDRWLERMNAWLDHRAMLGISNYVVQYISMPGFRWAEFK